MCIRDRAISYTIGKRQPRLRLPRAKHHRPGSPAENPAERDGAKGAHRRDHDGSKKHMTDFSFVQITDHHLLETEDQLREGFSPGYALRMVMKHLSLIH